MKTSIFYTIGVGGSTLVIAATFAALTWPVAVPIIVGIVAFSILAARKPAAVSALLVVAAIPFMRPNVAGEHYALVAVALCCAAAAIALASDGGQTQVPHAYLIVVASIAALSVWLLANASIFAQTETVPLILQGCVTTVLPIAAIGIVLADPARRRIIGLGFVWMMLALCASYAITLAIWNAGSVGAFRLFDFSIAKTWTAAVYAPFTPSIGMANLFGVAFPRFTGLGREPGWMAMYTGVAFFLLPATGRGLWIRRGVLAVGLLGTFSTAGFGAFVVVLILRWMIREGTGGDLFTRFIGSIVKLAALAAAVWVAINAPIVGLAQKGALNSVSLDDRSRATAAGLNAIVSSPLGGAGTGSQEAINLVAAIAPFGLPFFLLVASALVLPRFSHPARALTTAPIAVIFITLLLSQPSGDSTFVFVLAGLIYCLARPGMSAGLSGSAADDLRVAEDESRSISKPVVTRLRS